MFIIETTGRSCSICAKCIQFCPAKAITIEGESISILEDRCVGCGNCIRICPDGDIQIKSHIPFLDALLKRKGTTIACLDPVFPASTGGIHPYRYISALRALGFDYVADAAFGVDLVEHAYEKLLKENPEGRYIDSTGPVIVSYIQKFHPELIPYFAKIVSPMIAMGRLLKQEYGHSAQVVYIGPCLAKRLEARDPNVEGVIDDVLTFKEINRIIRERGIDVETLPESNFDPPLSMHGKMYPVGDRIVPSFNPYLQVVNDHIICLMGKALFGAMLKEYAESRLYRKIPLFRLPFCICCLNGIGMDSEEDYTTRRATITRFIEERANWPSVEEWRKELEKWSTLDLAREFTNQDKTFTAPQKEINRILLEMNKPTPHYELNCGLCGYNTCREYAAAVYQGIADKSMCLQYLKSMDENFRHKELIRLREELLKLQESLIQSEKLASMGQLAAGIAHEVNNPLGTILLYSHMLLESVPEGSQTREDIQLIVNEAKRCKTIVSALLNFARQSRLVLKLTSIRNLLENVCHLVGEEQGTVKVSIECSPDIPLVVMDNEQIKQVLLNMFTNAFDAMSDGGELKVRAHLSADEESVEIAISDTGTGIAEENIKKLFNPFFTTKQIGRGTGLGLAISYGIIKMHRGDIKVQSTLGKGTTFTIILPLRQPEVAKQEQGIIFGSEESAF
ncbi:MAG: [Fe-Fe] hydrogenase large subunit C-terminal domain-containing protein [bacterium]